MVREGVGYMRDVCEAATAATGGMLSIDLRCMSASFTDSERSVFKEYGGQCIG